MFHLLACYRRRRTFYVDAVMLDGDRLTLWEGSSYETAILKAEGLQGHFGPVFDLTS